MKASGCLKILFLFCTMMAGRQLCIAQDAIERMWYNEEKTAKVQIFKANDGKFYGKVVWLKEPNRDGKPKTDINNPDKAKRNDPVMGIQLLRGFKKTGKPITRVAPFMTPRTARPTVAK